MRIVPGSMGSFLCPPGHPMLFHHIEHGKKDDPNLMVGLDYALDESNIDVSNTLRARVRKMYDDAELVNSELWQRSVYGYFKNCYSPDGVDRNVSKCVIDNTDTRPPEHHLAYLTVRRYFPDAQPRVDLIASRGDYGSKVCLDCGKTVQYEAQVDGFTTAINPTSCATTGEMQHRV
jgi:hypothetical protein